MKSRITLIVLLFPFLIYAQKQVKADWPSLANSPWPVLRGDMQGTGRSEYIGPRSYKVKWVKDAPRGVIFGPVIGYDENLYFGEMAVHLEDTNNYFYSVNNKGEDLWAFSTHNYYPNMHGIVIGRDSTVYFKSASQILYALNKNGQLKWSVPSASFLAIELYMSKYGNIYFAGADSLKIVSPDGILKEYYYPKIYSSLSFSFGGDSLFIIIGGDANSGINGTLDATDLQGNLYWSRKFSWLGLGIPMVDNQNNIYVFGEDSISAPKKYLYSIKPDGSVRWQYQVGTILHTYTPTMDQNGNLTFYNPYIMNGNLLAAITSVDYNGNWRWTDSIASEPFMNTMDYGPVCDKEGKIYIGSNLEGGYFYCLDSNGVILWKNVFPNEYDSCPAIGSDGTLYIGLQKGDFNFNQTQTLWAINDTATGIEDERIEPVKDYQLFQNYPNPFNPSTIIKFSIPKSSHVELSIYNSMGQEVSKLIYKNIESGVHSVEWNATGFASGVYFYRLTARNFSETKKLILLK